MIKIGKVYISFFVFVLCFVCIISGAFKFMLMAYLSLFAHEMFHLISAKKLKINFRRMVILPFGINLELSRNTSSANEIILCASGPVGSGALALIFMSLYGKESYLFYTNLSLFLINALPIYPLDGGRILKCILEEKMGYYRAVSLSLWISQLCLFIVCTGVFLLIVKSKFNMSVMILCTFLIYSLSQEKKNIPLSFSKLLLYSKEKLAKANQLEVREIAVSEDFSVKNIFKNLSERYYLVILVVSSGGKELFRITETELIKRVQTLKNIKTAGEIM